MGPLYSVGVGVAEGLLDGEGDGDCDGVGDFDGGLVEHSHTPVPASLSRAYRDVPAGHVEH